MPTDGLTRQQLYDQVWSRPMVHVAKEHGLSDRGLAKLCARYEIPVPPRGYWAKKAHGHKVPQPPLPPPSKPHLDRIEIDPRPVDPAELPTEAVPEVLFELQPENRPVVQSGRGRPHPFVTKTRAALQQAKTGDRGLLWPTGGVLDITVSKAQVTRALGIMDALLRAFELRDWPLKLEKETRGLTVTVLGEPLKVSIDEKSKQVPHTPTAYELKYPTSYGPAYDLAPTGLLRLRIGDAWWQLNESVDTAKRPLEESLDRFMVRLVKTALRKKQQREEREARERERVEEQRRREEEEKKVKQWEEWMDGWSKAERIRRFASAVEEVHSPIEPNSRIAAWLEWAATYADRFDPLRDARRAKALK